MSNTRNYIYVDAHYEHPTTKKRMRWIRIQEGRVGELIVTPSAGSNCFASVQRFMDAVSLRDLERDEKSRGKKFNPADHKQDPNEAEQLPDQQMQYHGLYFDFDCDAKKVGLSVNEALGRSKADANKLVDWFQQMFDLNPAHIQVWFSGKKGFHVLIRPEVFAIRPHRHLTYIVKNVALQLKEVLKLETLDCSVYTLPRMWRIPNTVHPATGRYKIELNISELGALEVQVIVNMARGPRNEQDAKVALPWSHLWDKVEYKEILADEEAEQWWGQFVQLYEVQLDMKRLRPTRPIERPSGSGSGQYPVCVDDLMTNGPKPTGPNRNRVLLPIVGFFVDAGVERKQAHRMVRQWTETYYPDASQQRERVANGRTVVESGYRGNLRFSCRAIRGNSGKAADERVTCVGDEKCPWIKDPSDQDPEETPTVHLSDATNGCYMNTQVRVPVHVAAIAGHPFDLPIRGRIECGRDAGTKLCGGCAVEEANGSLNWKFDAEDLNVLELINVNRTQRKGVIRWRCGVPKNCFKARIRVLEHSNLQEVQIIPMVDFAQVYMDDTPKEDDLAKSYRHVVRRGFHLGHGLKANHKYMLEASVFPFPKDQRICFLFDKAEPAQNDIDQFVMTPERYQNLLVFQRRDNQTVEQKLKEIHRDFTANVHQIGGRFDLSIAIDLCYHSVIGFNFAGKFINKGWFELLILGDTGTGKGGRPGDRILTPRGWTTYGEVEVGDEVVGSTGKATKVAGVHHRGTLPMYRVTFRDEASVVVSGDHLWTISNSNWDRRGEPWRTWTTEEILAAGLHWAPTTKSPARSKYWIPTIAPVVFEQPEKEVLLHPYVVGVLLGDGCLLQVTPRLTNPEADVVENVRFLLPVGTELHLIKSERSCPTYSIVGLSEVMRELGFVGKRSETKSIPKRYLFGSLEERLALLRGLCDTDGAVDTCGRMIDYSTSSEALAEDLVFLVRSLGGLVARNGRVPVYEYKGEKLEGQWSYRLGIHMPAGMVPVGSKKHAWFKGKEQRYHRTIESIERVDDDECICIEVEAADGLYAADHFIVTHNSTMIERIMQHYGLGELIAGEDSKRTGLVYASIQMQGQWILRWGKIPQNDRRLLVIDEFGSIPQEEVAKMTQLRSEGRARGGGVNADYETWARTRLILLTNPSVNRGKLAGFNYGIQAAEALFKDTQDLRRTDMALIAESDEVDSKLINKRWDRTDYPHYYTADLCRNLVLWAWSREPHHIEWVDGAEDEVLLWADRMGDTYECDIPLAQRSDLRLKIARISAAVAARLFSTDSDAKKVLVGLDHVQFAAKFMDRAYRKPSMAYFEYARRYKQDNHFTKDKRDRVKEHLTSYDECDDIISTLLDVDLITKPGLADMVNLEADELKKFWKYLVGNRLIRRTNKGYRKTGAFTKFLKTLGSKKSGYAGELAEDFETGGDFADVEPSKDTKKDEATVIDLFPQPATPQVAPEPEFEEKTQLPVADEDDAPFFADDDEDDDSETGGEDPPF